MEYVVIETGGKQYKVHLEDTLDIDRLDVENGFITFDKILLYVKDDEVNIGKPYLSGISVKAQLLEDVRGKKIRVARFRAKSRYRKVKGSRPLLSRIKIEKIVKTPTKASR